MFLKEEIKIGQRATYCTWDQEANRYKKKEVQIVWIYDNQTAEVKHLENHKVELVLLHNLIVS